MSADFLEAVTDPKHERHAEVAEWIGGTFDPDVVEAEVHAQALAALAKQWSRKATTSRKRAT
jgi:hypothetical protein